MAESLDCLISQEEELSLHRRLLDGDVTASADLATTFHDQLIAWLVQNNRRSVPEELCVEAAEDAWRSLVKNPSSFDPSRGKRLGAYLCMSAHADLKNLLRREGRHRRHVTLEAVDLSLQAGKYLGRDDDPSLALQIQEESARAADQIVAPACDGLTDGELQALNLILHGERKTSVFAQALGISDLPKKNQRSRVKRVKDKLKKRIKRGANGDAEAP